MTRNQIIEALFTGKNFNECIGKMEPEHLREDLKMEVALIVCEWPDEKVVKLHQDKALEFYVVRVILNQIQSSTSQFYRKFRIVTVSYVEAANKENYFEKEGPVVPNLPRHSHMKRIIEHTDQITDPQELERREEWELIEDRALSEIESLYWYNAEMVRLYVKHGNYRAIEKETGIPFISCYKTIQKSFKELKQKALQ